VVALNKCKCPWSLNYSGPMAITLNSDVNTTGFSLSHKTSILQLSIYCGTCWKNMRRFNVNLIVSCAEKVWVVMVSRLLEIHGYLTTPKMLKVWSQSVNVFQTFEVLSTPVSGSAKLYQSFFYHLQLNFLSAPNKKCAKAQTWSIWEFLLQNS